MNAPADDVTMVVLIVLVLTIVILAAAYVAAKYTIERDEREAKRRAKANVTAWWMAADVSLLPEDLHADVLQLQRAAASDDADEAGDGSDEGLVRVPPDVLLRRTLVEQDGAA